MYNRAIPCTERRLKIPAPGGKESTNNVRYENVEVIYHEGVLNAMQIATVRKHC
jgi:hypothetical protein